MNEKLNFSVKEQPDFNTFLYTGKFYSRKMTTVKRDCIYLYHIIIYAYKPAADL